MCFKKQSVKIRTYLLRFLEILKNKTNLARAVVLRLGSSDTNGHSHNIAQSTETLKPIKVSPHAVVDWLETGYLFEVSPKTKCPRPRSNCCAIT
jgi:hypothetical protein